MGRAVRTPRAGKPILVLTAAFDKGIIDAIMSISLIAQLILPARYVARTPSV